ncbi:MAG: hypothetical protein EP322_02175, partial [Bacteroidetes bacterium]
MSTRSALLRVSSTLVSCLAISLMGYTQANIQVKVVSVGVTNSVDCDGFLTGDSDFVLEYVATDNTLGYSNNNPILFGFLGD